MPQVLCILFGALFTVAVALALGRLLLARLDLGLSREESVLFSFLTGSCLLSLAVFSLCALGLARTGVFLAAGGLAIAACLRAGGHRVPGPALPRLPLFSGLFFAAVYVSFGIVYFLHALGPEYSPDGITYHLGLVSRYHREHGFHPILTNMYASLSQGLEMLFLFAFAFGRHSSAALVHFVYLMTLPLAILFFSQRHGITKAGVPAAILVFTSPVVGIDGASAYNDVAAALTLFGLFYLLHIWKQQPAAKLLVLAGLLAGFAFALKYTAALAVPYTLGFVTWHLWKRRQPMVRPLALVLVAAGVSILPWTVKNAMFIGNPLAPFFSQVFPNELMQPDFEQRYRYDMQHFGDVLPKEIPREVTILGARLGGLLGPMFLIVPVALFALRFPMGRSFLLAGAVFASPYHANIGTRFLIPSLPFWSLAMALVLSRAPGMAPLLAVAHVFFSWPTVVPGYSSPHAWRIRDPLPWREALRIIPEDRVLAERTRSYVSSRMIEELVPVGERVFALGSTMAEAYTSRELLISFQAARNLAIREILLTPITAPYQPSRRIVYQFPRQTATEVRITQTAQNPIQHWSAAEIRPLYQGSEVDRDPAWSVSTDTNPWELAHAFDKNPNTRWNTRQPVRPNMDIHIDFHEAKTIDSLVFDASPDQPDVQLMLELRNGPAGWRTLSATRSEASIDLPVNMRRTATKAIEAMGVRYLLIEPAEDTGAADFERHASSWGLKLIDERSGFRLYKLE